MALYLYQGFSTSGQKIKGQIDAPSVSGVKELLKRQNIYPTSIELAYKVAQSQSFFSRLFSNNVPFKQKLMFTKQLAVLLKSGIPLLQALELLADQFEGKMNTILVSIKDGIKEGNSFAEGLSRYSEVFENTYVQLVKAGEASGKLEPILERLIDYLETQNAMRKKVTSALQGPIIQLSLILSIAFGLMVFVVPKLTQSFESQSKSLPFVTTIIMAIAQFIASYYLVIGIAFCIAFLLFGYWKSTSAGAYKIDQIKLKLPIVKFFAQMGAIVQFCSTLGMLLESGVHLSQALTIVCDIIDNRILKDALEKAKENIIKQGKITQYLKKTGIFPSIATYLIETGEESGNLDIMLLEVAKNYESELSEKAENLTVLLQPLMLIIMAVVVGTIVLAVALPMVSIGENLGI